MTTKTKRVSVKDNDGNIIVNEDVPLGESVKKDEVKVWWMQTALPGGPGEREYLFRDFAIWWHENSSDGARPPAGSEGFVSVQWTDDTDTNPRRVGNPADVTHTLEWPLPGGGMGPFIVQVE